MPPIALSLALSLPLLGCTATPTAPPRSVSASSQVARTPQEAERLRARVIAQDSPRHAGPSAPVQPEQVRDRIALADCALSWLPPSGWRSIHDPRYPANRAAYFGADGSPRAILMVVPEPRRGRLIDGAAQELMALARSQSHAPPRSGRDDVPGRGAVPWVETMEADGSLRRFWLIEHEDAFLGWVLACMPDAVDEVRADLVASLASLEREPAAVGLLLDPAFRVRPARADRAQRTQVPGSPISLVFPPGCTDASDQAPGSLIARNLLVGDAGNGLMFSARGLPYPDTSHLSDESLLATYTRNAAASPFHAGLVQQGVFEISGSRAFFVEHRLRIPVSDPPLEMRAVTIGMPTVGAMHTLEISALEGDFSELQPIVVDAIRSLALGPAHAAAAVTGEFWSAQAAGTGQARGHHCSNCNGTGTTACTSCAGRGRSACSPCRGTGKRDGDFNQALGSCFACFGSMYKSCVYCSGSGRGACTTCSGAGRLR